MRRGILAGVAVGIALAAAIALTSGGIGANTAIGGGGGGGNVTTVTMSGTAVTCPAGAGVSALTLDPACAGPNSIVVAPIVNSDVDGCVITVAEAAATLGCTAVLELSSSAGGAVTAAAVVNVFSPTKTWTPAVGDTLTMVRADLADDAWSETARKQVCALDGCTMTGAILGTDGSAAAPMYGFSSQGGIGMHKIANGRLGFDVASLLTFEIQAAKTINSAGVDQLVEVAAPSFSAGSDYLYADSTKNGLMASYNNGPASLIQREVAAITSADTTNITNTLADVTGLSVTLPVGTWNCAVDAEAQNSTGGEGLQMNWQFGGTSTTNSGSWQLESAASVITDCTAQAAASLTCAVATFATGTTHASARFVVTVAGTMKVQAAENAAHVAGTVTVFNGSTMVCESLN